MSDSQIGIRISLVGGKIAAVESDMVAKSVRGIGTATVETDVKMKAAGGASGGMGIMSRLTSSINSSAGAAGTALTSMGSRAEKAGVVGGAGMSKLGDSLAKAEHNTGTLLMQWANLGKYITVGAVAGFAAVTYETGKMYASFQAATGAVAANASITMQAATNIGKAMLTTSGSATYTATQLMEAYSLVGDQLSVTNGRTLNAAQAVGFMQIAWRLAEATGNSLNSSTQDLANTMQSFHLNTSQAATASNLLYNTSKMTGTGIDTLSSTEARLHSRLLTTMPSIQDMSGLLVDLGEHSFRGARGTQVVTSALNTMLGNTKDVNTMLASLGVHLYDSTGKFVGLSSVLTQLRPRLAGLTPQMQAMAEQTLFGQSGWQGMNAVIMDTNQTLGAATLKVENATSAHDAAEKKLKTLSGQWEIFKASAENAGVEIGSVLVPILLTFGKDLLTVGNYVVQHKALLIGLAVVIGGVLTSAVAAFTYVHLINMGRNLKSLSGDVISLSKNIWTFVTSTVPKFIGGLLGIGSASDEAAAGVAAESGAATDATATNDALAGAKDAAAAGFAAEGAAAGEAAGAVGAEGAVAAEAGAAGAGGAAAGLGASSVLPVAAAGIAGYSIGTVLNKKLGISNKLDKWLVPSVHGGLNMSVVPKSHQNAAHPNDIFGMAGWMNAKDGVLHPWTDVTAGTKAFGSSFGSLAAQYAQVPSFGAGGVVPGPAGAPALIIAHGGETISPISGLSGGVGTASQAAQPTMAQMSGLTSKPTGAGQPIIVQLVLDRKVIGQSVIDYMAQTAARGG